MTINLQEVLGDENGHPREEFIQAIREGARELAEELSKQAEPTKRSAPIIEETNRTNKTKAYDRVTDTLANVKLVDLELGYVQLSKHSAPWEMRALDEVKFFQYTGLADTYGDDIYEADVIQDTEYHRYRVCYGKHPEKDLAPYTFYLWDIDTDDIKDLEGTNYEIIGYWNNSEFFEN